MSWLRDIAALAGIAAVLYGLWLLHPAVPLLFGGSALMVITCWFSYVARRNTQAR